MSDPRQSEQGDVRDEVALDVEEVADLEMPAIAADDVRGGKCNVPGRDATTLPSGTMN